MSNRFEPIIEVKPDGLQVPEVGQWAEQKYKLVGMYCEIFTNSMHQKWNHLVYIDLFSGSGHAQIRGTSKIILTSPLISLSLPNNFTEYIFCELDQELVKTLKERISRDFVIKNFSVIEGDCNKEIETIINRIPQFSKTNTGLSFCFVDPFAIKNLCFSSIKRLAHFAMDFLILIPTGMDAKRNYKYFIDEKNHSVDEFIDDKDWRKEFAEDYNQTNSDFVQYISDKFDSKMIELGYLKPETKQQIRSSSKNLPLYHLAFYSKHVQGNKFWKEVKKYFTDQGNLFS